MQRYEEIVNIFNDKKKRRYETIYYPKFPPDASDVYFISKKLMRMDSLAYHYYGDVRYWWVIQRANNLPGGTLQIPAGIQIRVPNINKIMFIEDIKKEQF